MSRKNNNAVELRLVAEIAKRLGNGGLSAGELQSVLEKRPPDKSSLDDKIVAKFEEVGFTERNFHETIVLDGQLLKRHRNGGGWVPAEQDEHNVSMPYVAESAYVGPFARVYGNARVSGNAWVFGNARVSDNAQVYDNAQAYGNAWVFGSAQVYGNAWVSGNAQVYGNAWVFDKARALGNAWVSGNARVSGRAFLEEGHFFHRENIARSQ